MAVTSLTRRGGLLALGIALLAGCSQGSPASPPAQGPAFDPAPSGVPVSADPNVALLSAFDLRLDPVNGVAELNPLRSGAAIGDTWSEVGVTAAFKNMFGSNFEVEAIRPSGGQVIEVDFRTTHPFTPDRRPDLAIFNLKLWAVLDEFPQDIGGVQAVPGVVTNADGYGQMWSITHTDVSPTPLPEVQPYVILHEDPTSPPFDWQDPKGWNVLAPGQSTVDTVRFDLSGFGVVHLKLLLTADYGQSAVRATRQTPQYELPKFAGNAPWKIAVTEVSNTLVGNTSEGEATYRFDVWDWKHGQGLGSDVTQAWVRIPFILPDARQVTLTGSGRDPDPLTGTLTFTNELLTLGGPHWAVIEVTDSATGNAILNDLVTQVPVTNYRTYQFFVVDVALPAIPPEALFLYCTEGNLSVGVEERYDGSWSRMSNYPLVAWEWDFSYDETEGFNVEDTGRMVWHAFNEPGIYRVALRVRDEAGLEDLAYTDTVVGGLPTWQNPQRLTDNIFFETFGGPTEPANAIDVSADGVINLVYSYVSQDFTFFTEVAWIQLYPCDPIWSPPQVIWQSPPGTSAPLDVSLAVTEGDYSIIHVATASDTNSYLYLRYEDFQWNPPVAITDPTTEGTWVNGELARNDEGQVGFVGEIIPPQPDAMNGDGIPALPAQLYFHQRSGGGFGAATQIGTADVVTELTGRGSYTSISPSLAFSGAAGGGFMAVWETLTTPYDGQTTVPADAPTNLKWNHRTGATWDGEAGLPAPFNRVDAPVLALAPNGSVWLAASAGDAGNVYVNKYLPAGWTFWAPHLIEPDSTGAMVDLTIDADGRGALVIAQETGNNDLQARVFDEDEMPDTAAGHNPLVNVESRISQRRWWPQIQGQNSGRFAAVWMTEKYAAFPDGGELDWNMFQ